MNNYKSTTEITFSENYFDSPKSFFSNFSDAWANAKKEVYKIETRQFYDETGNESYDQLRLGNKVESFNLVPLNRQCDVPLYEDISKRKVDFVRCRPILKPLSDYIEWEFECYKFNSSHGEKIFIVNKDNIYPLFETAIVHDFMVFDSSVAFVHDYDSNGLLKGGWKINSIEKIEFLKSLFQKAMLKASKFNPEII